jgi:hypothetical protein
MAFRLLESKKARPNKNTRPMIPRNKFSQKDGISYGIKYEAIYNISLWTIIIFYMA